MHLSWLMLGDADGLMRCIFAGNVTKSAMNAFILVDVGNMMVVDVEVFPMGKCGHTFADEIINSGKAFFIHPVIEPFAEVFNYAEAMLHGGGANLYIGSTEKHKLHRILPRTDTANAGDGNFV